MMSKTDRLNILAVEDEADHLLALSMIFAEEKGYNFFPARDMAEGMSVLNNARIDVVILDIGLPGASGIEFCESLKKDPRYKHLPVIALSAFPYDLYAKKALAAGCTYFMEKPFNSKALEAKVLEIALNKDEGL